MTADPGGLALTTATSYEPAGPGAFHRRTARTLPSGAATTYEHYGPAEVVANPCPGGASANQAGLPRRATGPDPDGPGPEVARVTEVVHDAMGRPVATRVGTGPWACTTYDDRGRPLTRAFPAHGAQPARTVTYDHAVGANPLVASVTDPAGTVTAALDRLGRLGAVGGESTRQGTAPVVVGGARPRAGAHPGSHRAALATSGPGPSGSGPVALRGRPAWLALAPPGQGLATTSAGP